MELNIFKKLMFGTKLMFYVFVSVTKNRVIIKRTSYSKSGLGGIIYNILSLKISPVCQQCLI